MKPFFSSQRNPCTVLRPAVRNWLLGMSLLAGVVAVVPDRALAQRPLGIDVSSYQETVNWTSVKGAGITFAWAKATEGLTYIDAYFTANEANAKAAGVLIGAYHFAHPEEHLGTAGADQEAAYFWNEAGSYIKTNGNAYLMPVLDYETAPGSSYTKATSSQWVNEWCQDIVNYAKANGVVVTPVVYTYTSFASDWLDSTVIQWPLWMASPNGESAQTGAPSATSPWSTWEACWWPCTSWMRPPTTICAPCWRGPMTPSPTRSLARLISGSRA